MFHVGVTPDFLAHGREIIEAVLAEFFTASGPVTWVYLRQEGNRATPEGIAGFNAVLTLQMRFDAAG